MFWRERESSEYIIHHHHTQGFDQQSTPQQQLATATATTAARHACSSEQPQGCWPPPRRLESVLACHMGEGEAIVLGAGEREARRDGQLHRQKGKRAIEPAGTVLTLTQYCLLKTLVPARCCCCCCYCCVVGCGGSLGTSLWLAGSSSSRPRPNVLVVEVMNVPGTW